MQGYLKQAKNTPPRESIVVLHHWLLRLLFLDLCLLFLLPPLGTSIEILELPLIATLCIGVVALLRPYLARLLVKTEEWQRLEKNRGWAKGVLMLLLGLSVIDGLIHIARAGIQFLLLAIVLVTITAFRSWSTMKNRWREIERVIADRGLRRRRSEEVVALFLGTGMLASRGTSIIAAIMAAGTGDEITRIFAYLPFGLASLLLLTLLDPQKPLVEECKRCKVLGNPRKHSWCPACGKRPSIINRGSKKAKVATPPRLESLREFRMKLGKVASRKKTEPDNNSYFPRSQ